MRVLHVYRTYFPDPPGGLQEAIRQICISTQAMGVENTIFTLSPQPSPKVIDRPEARVVRCRSTALNELLSNAALAQRYGRAARERYEALFSGDALGRAYTRLYEDALKT